MKKGLALLLVMTGLFAAVPPYAFPDTDSQVVIKRDQYGVPHVYAKTIFGIFYGYGYAIAQDRLFQLEMARRSGQGLTAEVLGAESVNFDKKIRINYNPASIMNQLDALSGDDKAIFEGYATGVNAWIGEIRKKPDTLKPRQFIDFGFEPGDWTPFDVAMIFVGSMVNRFGDFNTELENEAILDALNRQLGKEKARLVFGQLLPLSVSDAPTTIPSEDWPTQSSVTPPSERNCAPMAALGDIGKIPNPDQLSRAFSNIVVLGKKKVSGAAAILMNGPQFGWYNPGYVYSVGLHGAGFNLVGNTPFGYPAVMFGHNDRIAWGSTWGAGDMIDVYREKLHPDDSTRYLFRDAWLPMAKRLEIIKVKDAPDVQFIAYRTLHGPVVRMDARKGVAYAKKRAWEGREVDTLIAWVKATRTGNFKEWIAEAERTALNINMYYADRQGNIGYAFTGKYPQRPDGFDNRLPSSGTGDAEWGELAPFAQSPKVYNPGQGFIVNWNNKPAENALNPDMFWYSWFKADRVEALTDVIKSRERFTPDDAWDIIRKSSFADLNARYFIPLIRKSVDQNAPQNLKHAAELLAKWDYQTQDRDGDGKYDESAAAIFQAFLPLMLKYTLQDDLGNAFDYFASPGYPAPESPARGSLNVQIGTKAVAEAILDPASQAYDFFNGQPPEKIALKALTDAMTSLEKKFGPDMAQWKLPLVPVEFTFKNFLNIPQAGQKEALRLAAGMNRGTENNMVVFTRDGVVAYEVTPPGQSGFVAPDSSRTPHYDDQLEMYAKFEKKRTWLSEKDVEAHKTSEIVLHY